MIFWAIYDPGRLSARAKLLLEDSDNDFIVSYAAVWELLNKAGPGGLPIGNLPVTEVYTDIVAFGVKLVPVSMDHIITAATLPDIHRDPFDRMFIAQALAEGVPLVTRDPDIWQYSLQTIWK